MNRTLYQYLLGASPILLLPMACGGTVEVGKAKGDTENQPTDTSSTLGSGGGSSTDGSSNDEGGTAGEGPVPNCDAEADAARAPYDAWQATPNDWGDLEGKTFSGYLEGGPEIVLSLSSNETATLVIGNPAPAPERDKGYLCDEAEPYGFQCPRLGEGATYPIFGAKLAGNRLTIDLQVNSAYDAWCVLQTPAFGGEDCWYNLTGTSPFSYDADGSACSLGSRVVDCTWLELAMDVNPCVCTSTECFAQIFTGDDGFKIDARVSESLDSIDGSLFIMDAPNPLYLELVED